MNNLFKTLLMICALSFVACGEKEPLEEAGDSIGDAAEDVQDSAGDAIDDAADGIDDLVDEVDGK